METTGKYYDVIAYKGSSSLLLYHRDSIKEVVSDIDDIVSRSKERGYNYDEKWIIVSVEWGLTLSADNVFLSSWEKRTSVALYDNGNVIIY